LLQFLPIIDLVAVDGANGVADAEVGLAGGAGDGLPVRDFDFVDHVANLGGGLITGGGLTDEPDDRGEEEREDEIEGRAGHKNEHAGTVTDRGQVLGFGGFLALDSGHIRELREGDIAPERKPRDTVLHAVFAFPREHLGAEADGESRDMHAPAPRGQEMTEFVDKNRSAEE
jgi:hypothetical protein